MHLLVVMTTDRGLCGGFNGSIMRGARTMVRDLEAEGKTVKLFGVGRKGNAIMRREFPDKLVDALEEIAKLAPSFAGANMIASKITEMFDNGDFDCCTVVYNKFISALTQEVTPQQLIPFAVPEGPPRKKKLRCARAGPAGRGGNPRRPRPATRVSRSIVPCWRPSRPSKVRG